MCKTPIKDKLCPFCGGEPETDFMVDEGSYLVECHECGARAAVCESAEDAWQAWNERVVPVPDVDGPLVAGTSAPCDAGQEDDPVAKLMLLADTLCAAELALNPGNNEDILSANWANARAALEAHARSMADLITSQAQTISRLQTKLEVDPGHGWD